jgi:hypothetical protein
MMVANNSITGTIHGKTVELDQEPGLPDGTRVQVAVVSSPNLTPGEGIKSSFGSWAGDDAAVDEFLKQVRKDRDSDPRPELSE